MFSQLIFPVSHIINNLSITLIMVIYGMTGQSEVAAEIGLLQATSAMLFSGFSANARVVILSSYDKNISNIIGGIRLLLIIPICLLIYFINEKIEWIYNELFYVFIIRRVSEWIYEIELSDKERYEENKCIFYFTIFQVFILILLVYSIIIDIYDINFFFYIIWSITPFICTGKLIKNSILNIFKISIFHVKMISPHLGSSIIIAASLFLFRWIFVYLTGKSVAGLFFTAYAIGGLIGGISTSALAPSIVFQERNSRRKVKFSFYFFISIILYLCIALSLIFSDIKNASYSIEYDLPDFFWKCIGFSMVGGIFVFYSQVLRNRLLINNIIHNLFISDLIINIAILLMLPILYFVGEIPYLMPFMLFSPLISFGFFAYIYNSKIKDGEFIREH